MLHFILPMEYMIIQCAEFTCCSLECGLLVSSHAYNFGIRRDHSVPAGASLRVCRYAAFASPGLLSHLQAHWAAQSASHLSWLMCQQCSGLLGPQAFCWRVMHGLSWQGLVVQAPHHLKSCTRTHPRCARPLQHPAAQMCIGLLRLSLPMGFMCSMGSVL